MTGDNYIILGEMLGWIGAGLALISFLIWLIWAKQQDFSKIKEFPGSQKSSEKTLVASSNELNPYRDRVAQGQYLLPDISWPSESMNEDTHSYFDTWGDHYEASEMGFDFVNHIGTHIAMFLQWNIENNFYLDDAKILEQSKKRQRELAHVPDLIDFQPMPDHFSSTGRAFSMYYYAQYLRDFYHTFCEQYFSVYNVPPTWENYERMAAVIDQRFAEWKARQEEPI